MNTSVAFIVMTMLICAECAACDTKVLPGTDTRTSQLPVASQWRVTAEKYGVDPLDLCAIAFQESRRHRPDGFLRPWPWTLHTSAEGAMYFSDCSSALTKLEQLIAQGQTNIDVGLMQINWGHHNHRVSEPAELLRPARNIEVAAKILRENLDASGGDLQRAIAWYHSRRPALGLPYAAAVLTIREYLSVAKGTVCSPHGPGS